MVFQSPLLYCSVNRAEIIYTINSRAPFFRLMLEIRKEDRGKQCEPSEYDKECQLGTGLTHTMENTEARVLLLKKI
jgi:hypothetical protein